MPGSKKTKMLPNFASVLDTGNASFAGANNTNSACLACIVDNCEAPLETLTVRRDFKGTISKIVSYQ
jgi:hypothetical protein